MPTYPTYNSPEAWCTDIANAIRELTGESGIVHGTLFASKIRALATVIPSNLPNDGKTRVGICIPDNVQTHGRTVTLMLYQSSSTTSTTVNWGDNSAEVVTTGSGRKTLTHTYSSSGNYIYSIDVTAGSIYFGGGNSYTIYGAYQGNTTAYARQYIQWVVLGSGVTKLDSYSFYYCTSLKEIKFSTDSGFTTLGQYSLAYCYKLTSVVIPNSVTTLSTYVFSYCTSLKRLVLPTNTTLKAISNYTTQYCYSLESVTIPSQFTSLGTYVFRYCTALESITLPSTFTSIGSYAFAYAYNLRYISLPSTVTSLGTYAISYCYGLQKIRFNSASPPTVSDGTTFTNLPTSCIISVPTGKLSTYTGTANYPSSSTYTYIEE